MIGPAVLVTGASGFVGKALCEALLAAGCRVYGTTRAVGDLLPGVERVIWSGSSSDLANIPPMEIVVHLAARVHVMRDDTDDAMAAFRYANVEMTRQLALWAEGRSVKRFVFMSSIKVNGESTAQRSAFSADDVPAPADAYALSKLEAEQVLRAICSSSGMELVVIRPPLVYGPGVQGNFCSMVRWVKRGIPLPLGAIPNRRSLVALDNLVSFTMACLGHPAAANQVFLVSDGEPISTADMLRKIARAYRREPRLLAVPQVLLRWGARVIGKSSLAERLLGSLEVDDSKAHYLLGWRPTVTMDEQLRKMAQDDACS